MKKISFTLLAFIAIIPLFAQHTSTFDDLSLPADSFEDGSHLSGGFLSGDVYFNNNYNTAFQSWSGFSYSNKKDTVTSGYSNQYSSAAGGGAQSSAAFAVSYAGSDAVARMRGFAAGKSLYGMYVTNSTYAYLSMKNGDMFAKKFGGPTGHDPDWFRLTARGWYHGAPVADSAVMYLADFRASDTLQHYIVKEWRYMDLSMLGNVDSIYFNLESSDTGAFGMNTPGYFCADNLTTSDGVALQVLKAVDDTAGINYHDTLHVNILANDTFNAGSNITVSLTGQPQVIGASAYIDDNNQLVYVPAVGIRTTDTLSYSLCDQTGACSSALVLITVSGDTNTAISELLEASTIVYPNPARERLYIHTSAQFSAATISDMSGRAMIMEAMDKKSSSIDISTLSGGIYLIQIHSAGGSITRKFIKE